MMDYLFRPPLLPFVAEFDICDRIGSYLVRPHMTSPHFQPRIDDSEPNNFRREGSNQQDDYDNNQEHCPRNHEACDTRAQASPSPTNVEHPSEEKDGERQHHRCVSCAAVEPLLLVEDSHRLNRCEQC